MLSYFPEEIFIYVSFDLVRDKFVSHIYICVCVCVCVCECVYIYAYKIQYLPRRGIS